MSYKSDSDDECKRWMERAANVTDVLSGLGQDRFTSIPDAHLNKATVVGIRDANLGRIKNGQPVGAPTIQFNSGVNTGYAHIKIGPKGAPNSHIKVSNGVIKGAVVVSKTLKYAGITLSVAGAVINVWQIASAFKEDVHTLRNAPKIIRELEDAIKKLDETLMNTSDSQLRSEIKATIEHLSNVLRDVKRTTKVPVKTLKAMSSFGGGTAGGMAGGTGGVWAGVQTGTMIGAMFGPVGAAVGAPVGAIVGGFVGVMAGGYGGSKVGEAVCNEVLKLAD